MLPEKITLIDLNKPLVNYWNEVFKDDPQVSAEQCDYFEVPADAMVSPANSFGIMDGGIDLAIRNVLGKDVEKRVQERIVFDFHGELPIGFAFVTPTGNLKWPHLVVAPTMRTPGPVRETTNAYVAFRAILLAIHTYNLAPPPFVREDDKIHSLVCCGLATGCGKMSYSRCAVQMKAAWDQVTSSPELRGFDEIHAQNRLLWTI